MHSWMCWMLVVGFLGKTQQGQQKNTWERRGREKTKEISGLNHC